MAPPAASDKAGAAPAVPERDDDGQRCGFAEPQEGKAVRIDAEAAAIDAEAARIGADPLEAAKRPFDPEAFQEPEGGSGNG